MAELIQITDTADERLADYAALTDAELRKRYEREAGVLIAEGPNPVRELVTSPYPLRSVLIEHGRVEAMSDVLSAIAAPVYVVDRDLLYEVVRFRLHQGVLACGSRVTPPTLAQVLRDARRVLLLEGSNDHENLGTLFRSARGLGVDSVVLGPGCADPLYRRSVRVSMGHVLHVPFAWASDLEAAFAELRSHGFRTIAMTPGPDALDVREVAVGRADRVAVALGAEGPGLTDAALRLADVRVRITMRGGVDSLNVAAAGAIALHALEPAGTGSGLVGPQERVGW